MNLLEFLEKGDQATYNMGWEMSKTYFKLYPNEKHFKKKVLRFKRKWTKTKFEGNTVHWKTLPMMIKNPTSCVSIIYST